MFGQPTYRNANRF